MARRPWLPTQLVLTAAALGVAACYSSPDRAAAGPNASPADAAAPPGSCTQAPIPDGAPAHVSGTVVEALGDGGAGRPLAGAMASAEYGGLYLAYCDMARASPYYLFGAVTDANGHFEMDARAGFLGFHSFATRYFYSRGSLDTGDAGTLVLAMEPLPASHARPTVTGAGFDTSAVAPGAPVTFSATVTTTVSTDPLSDEIVLVEPTRSWSRELDPPSAGKKDDFPSGLWKATFSAPDKAGDYIYYFSATTSQCVTTDVQPFTLTVR
jgi:hypothetical protein